MLWFLTAAMLVALGATAFFFMVQVPVFTGDIAVASKGALYRYEEPRIEQLTGAQEQLARMGPQNVRIIQSKLASLRGSSA